MSIRLKLPVRPVTQNRFWGHRNNRKYIKKEGREWREQIQWLVKSEINKGSIIPYTDEDLFVAYTFGFKDKRYGDTFNYEKALSDSLEGLLFDNDKQFKPAHVDREVSQQEDYIEVFVTEYASDDHLKFHVDQFQKLKRFRDETQLYNLIKEKRNLTQ